MLRRLLHRLGLVGPDAKARLAALVAAGRCEIGAHSYGTPLVRSWDETTRLSIGRFTSIAGGVQIFLGGNHRTDWVSTFPFPAFPKHWPAAACIEGWACSAGDVRIGSDVWLGDGCLVLGGVEVGHGAVVAARAVVARDVPPYAIVAGNPARVVRIRFDEPTVARLLRVAWWDLPEADIAGLAPLLCSPDVALLLARAEALRATASRPS